MDPTDQIRPRRYYDDLGAAEWDRLVDSTKNRLEFDGTTDYLREHLPGAGRVLDAGGGPGRYAVWLAERGYEVEHCDVSPRQVDLARDRVAERRLGHRARVRRADVRDLPYGDDAFDAVCCLGGPLSHVTDPGERERAAAELHRVARDGAPAFVSVMGFVAVVQNLVKSGPEFRRGIDQLPALLERQTYDGELLAETGVEDPTFVACHFFRADELEALLERHGFAVETVAGLEGPASNFGDEVARLDEEGQATVVETVERLREDRTFADLSNHVLAVARA